MGFREIDLQRNAIVKKLGALLTQIDPRVKWADYVPGGVTKTGRPLMIIGTESGVKYVDVGNLSPFKLVNEVLNAMDDYCLDVQFLNERQCREIEGDIAMLAKDRARVADHTLSMLSESIEEKDCLAIVRKAQEAEVFPQFFPLTEEPDGITTETIRKFLTTNSATFVDTQIIADLVEEQLKTKEGETAEHEY